MWDFFKRNSKKLEIESIINLRSTEIRMNEFLFEHGKSLIANCIAKSNICTVVENENVKENMYYLLNIRPNPNQTATEFWLDFIDKYFSYKGEALIVIVGSNLYVADSYTKSNDVILGKTFTDVSVTIDGNSIELIKQFNADQSIFIRRKDKKIDYYLNSVNDKISELMIASMSGYRKKSPKSILKIPNGIRLTNENGEVITRNKYSEQLSKELDNPSSSVVLIPAGLELDVLKDDTNISADEIKSIFNQAATNVAIALNIPINAFLGSITEKSDAIDELITFSVSVIVEQINDSLNYCLMSKDSYLKGSKIFFDLSNCKHRDILSNATAIDKLVADGFSHNEILDIFGKPTINEDWANEHHITKNYGKADEESKGGDE